MEKEGKRYNNAGNLGSRPVSPAYSYSDSITSLPTLDVIDRAGSDMVVNMSAKDKIDAIFRENEKSIINGTTLALRGDNDRDSVSGDSGSMLDILAHHMKNLDAVAPEGGTSSPTDILLRFKELEVKPLTKQKLMLGNSATRGKKTELGYKGGLNVSQSTSALKGGQPDLTVTAQKSARHNNVNLPRVRKSVGTPDATIGSML